MKDIELQKNRYWRFVNIKPGTKVPWQQGWQTHPLELENIYSDSVGLVMGPLSSGLCAIDFDGIEAWDHYYNTFSQDILDYKTVSWTSGKEYRLQMLFTVPEMYWDVLKKKVVNKMELRWTGCQSVLPPSIHPDTQQPYIWINRPTEHSVLEIPSFLLEYWLELMYTDLTKYDNTKVDNTYYMNKPHYSVDIVNELLEHVKQKVGNCKGDYDVFRTIAWATCSEIGVNNATQLLRYHFPYKANKEMKTIQSYRVGVGPTVATLIKLSGLNSKQILEIELKHKYVRPDRVLSTYEAKRMLRQKTKIY